MGPRGLNCGPFAHTHQPRAPRRPARLTRGNHRRRSKAQRPLKGAAEKAAWGEHCWTAPLLTAGSGPGEGGEGKKRKEGKRGEGQGLP